MTRITRNMLSSQVLGALQRNLADLAKVQAQVSTGRRYQRVGDNPIDYTESLSLRQEILTGRRYVRNGEISLTALQLTESSLGQVTDLLQRARELALSAANEALPPESRTALADEIQQIFLQIQQVANSAFERGYLFAGHETATRPFTFSSGYVVYNGDVGRREIDVGRGATVPATLHGLETFIAQPNVLISSRVGDPAAALASQLAAPGLTPAAGAFSLNGVSIVFDPATESLAELRNKINAAQADVIAVIEDGRLVLTGRRSIDIDAQSGTFAQPGNVLAALGMFKTIEGSSLALPADLETLCVTLDRETIDVDVSGAASLSDIVARVRTATGGRVDGYVGAGGLVLTATYSAETFAVGNARRAFGADLATAPLTLATPLAALDLIGPPFGSVVISNGIDAATIDLSTLTGAHTVGDLIARIESAGLNLDVKVSAGGRGLDIVSRDPTSTLLISDGAGPATATAFGWTGAYDADNATALGLNKTGTSAEIGSRSVLQTMLELEKAVRGSGNAARVNELIGALDRDMTSLLDARSMVGARVNRLEASAARASALDIYFVSLLSAREDVDLTQALADLASRENVLQASLAAASRVLQPSLINFLS